MKEQAVAKLKTEMDGNLNNSSIQLIGGYLSQYVEMHPDAAEKIMTADKTIGKSLEAMKAEARKKQHNGMAMLTDPEGYAIVLKYFGIEGAVVAPAAPAPVAATDQLPSKPGADFNVNLSDFGL